MSADLFAAALASFGTGAIIDLLPGSRSRLTQLLPYAFGLVGSAVLFILGIHTTTSRATRVNLASLFDVGHGALTLDPLTGLFLTLLFGIAVCVSLGFLSWVQLDPAAHRRGMAFGYLLLLASVAAILCAADAFIFLFAWELLTVSFYVLTSVTRSSMRQVGAAWATVGVGKVSGAALLLGFLILASRSGSFTIASWHAVTPGALHDAAWVLVVLGFGAKLGVIPFQIWMPVGYPAAPGPARAAMAGIAANVGVYGLWRFLGVLGPPPTWLDIAVLLIGGATALLGITFAGVQSRLSRVIAYSSIENAGLIVTAYGVALTGVIIHVAALVAMGLLAATLQTISHAIAKSTLFVSLANIEAATGTDDLDALRGIGRKMPWSGATFAVGALTLAGLPPTIGFVSEWFILEALMQQFRVPGLALRLALAGAGALVALTAGLATLAFLRVLGLTLLGRPASSLAHVKETGFLGKVGLSVLALGCLVLAALSPLEVRFIAHGLEPLVSPHVTTHALKSPWILQPVFSGFSILSPSWLWIAMPTAFVVVFLAVLALTRGRYLRVRRVPSWHSASSGVRGPSSYTAFGFANPLRHVLANVLGARRTVNISSSTQRFARDEMDHAETTTRVIEPLESYLYRPLRSATLNVARAAKRLQSGNLNAYVAYMLFVLLALLALTAALH